MLPPEITHPERAKFRKDVEREMLPIILMGHGSQLGRSSLQPASHILVQGNISVFSIPGCMFACCDFLGEQVFGLLTSRRGDTDPEAGGVAIIDDPHVTIFALPNGHVLRLSLHEGRHGSNL